MYVTTNGDIVLDVDDLARATRVAGGMAAMSDECGVVPLDLLVGGVCWFVYLRPRDKDRAPATTETSAPVGTSAT